MIRRFFAWLRSVFIPESDELDGLCDERLQPAATADDELDGVALFADVDPADTLAIARRVDEYERLFGDKH